MNGGSLNYAIVFVLVVLSGTFSGLTLGMFSLNVTLLERKIKLGDVRAQKILTVRKKSNLLLCTLLLGNVAVNSAMAIFLGSIATGVIAGIISTGLIVVFGEIFPQAVFARHALALGAKTVWLVRFFIALLLPVSWPLARLLDKILGKESPVLWSKQEIMEIIKFHEDSPASPIDSDEERISLGALSFSDKTAGNIYTPRSHVYCLQGERLMDSLLLSEIKESGFSRIPVYLESDPLRMGILMVKELIGIKGNENRSVWEFVLKENLIIIPEHIKLDMLLNMFIQRKMHLGFVFDKDKKFIGIVSLEDVLEEILREEIFDEIDKTTEL